jgi:hypothetical protein
MNGGHAELAPTVYTTAITRLHYALAGKLFG